MGSPIAGQWIYSSKTLVNIYARTRVDVHYINYKKLKAIQVARSSEVLAI